jgi:hypothetical protein
MNIILIHTNRHSIYLHINKYTNMYIYKYMASFNCKEKNDFILLISLFYLFMTVLYCLHQTHLKFQLDYINTVKKQELILQCFSFTL